MFLLGFDTLISLYIEIKYIVVWGFLPVALSPIHILISVKSSQIIFTTTSYSNWVEILRRLTNRRVVLIVQLSFRTRETPFGVVSFFRHEINGNKKLSVIDLMLLFLLSSVLFFGFLHRVLFRLSVYEVDSLNLL